MCHECGNSTRLRTDANAASRTSRTRYTFQSEPSQCRSKTGEKNRVRGPSAFRTSWATASRLAKHQGSGTDRNNVTSHSCVESRDLCPERLQACNLTVSELLSNMENAVICISHEPRPSCFRTHTPVTCLHLRPTPELVQAKAVTAMSPDMYKWANARTEPHGSSQQSSQVSTQTSTWCDGKSWVGQGRMKRQETTKPDRSVRPTLPRTHKSEAEAFR